MPDPVVKARELQEKIREAQAHFTIAATHCILATNVKEFDEAEARLKGTFALLKDAMVWRKDLLRVLQEAPLHLQVSELEMHAMRRQIEYETGKEPEEVEDD